MSTRQMEYPDVRVEATDHDEVSVRLMIPGSRFGPVYVILTRADAEALAADLLEATR